MISWGLMIKDGVAQSLCGISHASHPFGISSRTVECVFRLYIFYGWLMDKLVLYHSWTSLLPVHQSWRHETHGWPMQDLNQGLRILDTCDSQMISDCIITCRKIRMKVMECVEKYSFRWKKQMVGWLFDSIWCRRKHTSSEFLYQRHWQVVLHHRYCIPSSSLRC